MTYEDISENLKEIENDAYELVELYEYMDKRSTKKELNTSLFLAMRDFMRNEKSPEQLFKKLMADIVVGFECEQRKKRKKEIIC